MKKYEIVITPEIHDAIIAEGLELFYPLAITSLIGFPAYYSDHNGWSYHYPHPHGTRFYLFNTMVEHDRFTEMMKRSFPEALL